MMFGGVIGFIPSRIGLHIYLPCLPVKSYNAYDKIFPYIQQNLDGILTIDDGELVDAFLDMMEKHKMIVENAGLLTIAALKHLGCKGKNVVPILSGG